MVCENKIVYHTKKNGKNLECSIWYNESTVYQKGNYSSRMKTKKFCLNSCAGFVEQAKGLEMDAIASAVIGGTLLSGVGTNNGNK